MGRFTQIPKDTFDALQLDAGILLYNFDVAAAAASKDAAGYTDNDFICATTGGIEVNASAEYSDLAEDVDNAPNNLKEFKHLDSWECTMAFTSLSNDEQGIRLALGAADIAGTGVTKVVPRRDLKQTDFSDIWWVGDKANGGFVAVKLLNALSNEGFSLTTEKNGKGQTSVTLLGHVSIKDQDTMPMEFYSIDTEEEQQYSYVEVTPTGTENPSEEGWYELVSGEYTLTTDTKVDSGKTYYERVTA